MVVAAPAASRMIHISACNAAARDVRGSYLHGDGIAAQCKKSHFRYPKPHSSTSIFTTAETCRLASGCVKSNAYKK
eukprot:6442274-Amphidinium_carterae.1